MAQSAGDSNKSSSNIALFSFSKLPAAAGTQTCAVHVLCPATCTKNCSIKSSGGAHHQQAGYDVMGVVVIQAAGGPRKATHTLKLYR